MRSALLLMVLFAPGIARGVDVIHRCTGPDGDTVYTDRPCSESGSQPITQPQRKASDASIERSTSGSTQGASGALSLDGTGRSDCVRRIDTLLFEVRGAIESQNLNRLAGVYDWTGKSSHSAAGILDRLARITSRPLASVEFRYPAPEPHAPPLAAADMRPIGVHIEQRAPGEIVPSFEEDLHLVRNAACWWLSF